MKRARPAPGSEEERLVERKDRATALVMALLVHAAFALGGNRSTDARPLVLDPGAGPDGPMPVIALSPGDVERLLARLGSPSDVVERGEQAPALTPSGGASTEPSGSVSSPSLPPIASGPRARSEWWAEAAPPAGRAADPAPARERPTFPALPNEAASPLPPSPAPAPPAGSHGEAESEAAAASGDAAPLLDLAAFDLLVRHRRNPAYPDSWRRQGLHGNTVLRFEFDAHWRVERIDIARSSGHRRLDESALRAMRESVFSPEALAAHGHRHWYLIVRFELDG